MAAPGLGGHGWVIYTHDDHDHVMYNFRIAVCGWVVLNMWWGGGDVGVGVGGGGAG